MKSKGIQFILLATLSFAVMNVIAKYLVDFHPLQVVFFRAAGTAVFIIPYMIQQQISFIGNNPKLLFLRSAFGLISLATFFIVIQRIPLGSAISIRYLGPIFGAILAYFFLKEKVNWGQWLSFFVAFAGVVVLKGFDLRIDYLSLLLCLISAVTVGVVFALVRYLATREHHLTIINYFMVFCILGSLFFIPHWRWPVGFEWYPVLSIGVFGLIGQILMTLAFKFEEATVIAPFKYMEIVYAMIISLIVFGEWYSLWSMFGILIIVLGMLASVYFKNRQVLT